jgi:hypothetical protein
MGEGIPLSCAFLPLPPVAKVMGKTLGTLAAATAAECPLINFLSIRFDLPVCPVTQVSGSWVTS